MKAVSTRTSSNRTSNVVPFASSPSWNLPISTAPNVAPLIEITR